MKNKGKVFQIICTVLLVFGSQMILFGKADIKDVQNNINKLKTRVDNFLKQGNLQPEKEKNAKTIQTELEDLKKRANEIGAGENIDPEQVDEINAKLKDLENRFTNPNYKQDPSKGDGSPSTPLNPIPKINSDIQRLEDEVGDLNSKLNEESKPFTTLQWILIGFAGLVVLGGIGSGIFFLWRNKQRERAEINGLLSQLKKQQKVLGEEVKQLTEVSKNLSQQMAQHKAEISGFRQAIQKVSSAPPPPISVNAFQEPKEVSQFPVSVDEYLAKSKNDSIPVKYDYKERILVQDGEREGGLLIVRDGASNGQLYLVPSFGFFQTKSDYTNYFERYYACSRPAGGSVWIRQPATVNPVNGGWQLANQGELEVR